MRLDHAQLVITRVSEHDEARVGGLAHVNVATTKAHCRLDGPLLVLEAAAGQVQVHASRADLIGVGRDEPEADLRIVTRHQRAAGLHKDFAFEQPAQNAATVGALATSKVTASRRESTTAPYNRLGTTAAAHQGRGPRLGPHRDLPLHSGRNDASFPAGNTSVESAVIRASKRCWAALGPHNNEKRRLTLEDVERRFRRSAAVFGNY